MKIGDIVYSTKIRPNTHAVVTNAEVVIKEKELKNGNKKKETRTKYQARFDDGSMMVFYGFDIDRSIFKVEESDGQMCLSQFMEMEV
jgi:hypothetical protein